MCCHTVCWNQPKIIRALVDRTVATVWSLKVLSAAVKKMVISIFGRSFFLFKKNETDHSCKNNRIRKTRKVIAQKVWARGEITSKTSSVCRTTWRIYRIFYFLVLFSPPLAALSTSCQPVEQRNNKEKRSRATLTYLCIYFCIYSLPPPLAGIPLARCLSIQLWAAWQLFFSIAHRNQTKH